MRFDVRSVAWAIYTASLLSGAQADADASSKTVANKPEFTPTTISGAPFLEQFTDDWKKRWTVSAAKKDDPKSEEDWAYVGEWEVEEPYKFKGIEGDKGLVVKSPAAHHAISAVFPKKINNKGKTLVVQYEVKLQGKSSSFFLHYFSHTSFQMDSSAVEPT
jgi:calnexin